LWPHVWRCEVSLFKTMATAEPKVRRYVVKTTVERMPPERFSTYQKYCVTVEGSGFTGTGTEISLSEAFKTAYEDLMVKVSEAIFTEEKL
jgi:hypothetical protein